MLKENLEIYQRMPIWETRVRIQKTMEFPFGPMF
jgi:hypothetical protein